MAQDRIDLQSFSTLARASALVEARFIPRQYEPNYAYPLLVLLHSRGGDEDQLIRAMPSVSRQNYVGLGLRAPRPVMKRDRLGGYCWGPDFELPERVNFRGAPSLSDSEAFRRSLTEPETDPIRALEEGVFQGIRQTRSLLHVHSERIFLVGCGEGAAVAYRLGLTFPERFAGVVAINGWIPGGFRPLGRLKACRDFPVLVVHGAWNSRVPLSRARRDVSVLRAGGLRVAFQSYPCNHRLDSNMLSDVDAWLMNHCANPPAI